ncbi:MAG: hypothetical protein A3B99_04165 [Candidatus Yanofskybacteria bacterium RIFCSPHIGHO2_02_FULL_44_12b]|uniref:Uncharacterized protein n=2 Tax=Candidatus Yanofskyibacteriota TaxID=1752733 RepID=A0A1F8GMX0_9BACT|nr:MAG: hypothetical protein UW79_C0019G0017 [Candidatus Yanofskybacteria bacterium GW2011_GWA2_44_9]OGN04625.1 MAG: hypothetical protein A2659_00675 [Candidatus Yanofskybacteria bacterium RIFCSPHIGHO2_01_FULL_44_24]OGN15709.1 MAG: hypothetical protein A3B99_04165 [Candidatus Yanofskybacteria bacterium RIFCSPHIGHO2_02_FULL_44_12b]OGN26765.1 MAG: hypothetical protein A2925_04250 [Candidatus Yanofskybacteria bacterium RIFCSPLOWO2_01_FULL_44_22]
MKLKDFAITNFAYGNGPYLRTTELALSFNDRLEEAGEKRFGIIVPLVYGDKQKRIMSEDFGTRMDEIVLDPELGAILKGVFYDGGSYLESLGGWVDNFEKTSESIHRYLKNKYGDSIVVELNRSPRVRYDIAPSYFTSFGFIGEILERIGEIKGLAIPEGLLNAGIKTAGLAESGHRIHCLAYPATFAHLKDRSPRCKTEVEVPPIMLPPAVNNDNVERGIYITVSGIAGLGDLYANAGKFGAKIYTNNPDLIPGSIKASPRIIPNKNILFQFARSGWGSVWLSMISGTPLVVPAFDLNDDPEIYFNNKTIEQLGIGIIYRGQPIEEILEGCAEVKKNSVKVCEEVKKRWGTLDGNRYCAGLFVKDLLGK